MTSITLSLLFIHFLGRKEGEMKAFWDKSEPFLVFFNYYICKGIFLQCGKVPESAFGLWRVSFVACQE